MTTIDIREALSRPLGRLSALSSEEQLTVANDVMDQLRAITAEVSGIRRAAVRDLRMLGYSLAEIAEMTGTSLQRVHQIESGYNRKEQAARKKAR